MLGVVGLFGRAHRRIVRSRLRTTPRITLRTFVSKGLSLCLNVSYWNVGSLLAVGGAPSSRAPRRAFVGPLIDVSLSVLVRISLCVPLLPGRLLCFPNPTSTTRTRRIPSASCGFGRPVRYVHIAGSTGEKVRKLKGKSTRRGTYKCYTCLRPFTVKVGTGFESSHLELHLWLQAIYLVSFAKRRITIRELQQTLGIARKTAWILNQRIRELITREDEPAAVVGDQRSAVAVETLARAETQTADRDRMKPASALAIADPSPASQGPEAEESKGEPNREHRKPRPKRGSRQPHPDQLTLFQEPQCRGCATRRSGSIRSIPCQGARSSRRKRVRRCSSGHFEKLLSASSLILSLKEGENDRADRTAEGAPF